MNYRWNFVNSGHVQPEKKSINVFQPIHEFRGLQLQNYGKNCERPIDLYPDFDYLVLPLSQTLHSHIFSW